MNRKGYWLGFFFFVILLMLVFTTLTVGEVDFFAKPHFYWTHFKAVEGLKIGDDIRLEGVVMGKVHMLQLHPESGVNVQIRMNQPLALLEGSDIYVETLSIIGGNFISITRGPGPGKWDMTQVLPGKLRANGLTALGSAVEENRKTLQEVLLNIRDAFGGAKDLIAAINRGEGTLGRLAKDEALYEDARATLLRLQKAAEDIQSITGKINAGEGSVAKLINSSELHDQVSSTLDQLSKAAGKINSGEGLVSRALNDKKIADDFAASVEKLRSITEGLEKITNKISSGTGTVGELVMDDKVVQEAKRALENVEKTLGRAARSKVFLGGEYNSYGESGVDISKFYLRIEPDHTKYFRLGGAFIALDAEEDVVTFKKQVEEGESDVKIAFDLEVMYKIPWFFDNHVGIRGGMFEGKPGLGLDVDFDLFDHEFRVTAEARDAYGHVEDEDLDENVHGPMSRLWFRTPLWNKEPKEWYEQILYAAKAYVGVSRLQDDPEFIAGIGLEYSDEDIRTLVSLISTAR